jgi:hypothetical protein
MAIEHPEHTCEPPLDEVTKYSHCIHCYRELHFFQEKWYNWCDLPNEALELDELYWSDPMNW